MATIIELVGSRSAVVGSENPSRKLLFRVAGTDDETVAEAAVAAEAPLLWAGLYRQDFRTQHEGAQLWRAEVPYGRRQPRKIGTTRLAFDTGGEKAKVYHSLKTEAHPRDGIEIIDYQGAVNVKKVGDRIKVDGVDITIPRFAFTVEQVVAFPPPGAYISNLFLKTGTINSDEINIEISGWTLNAKPHELLFLGATGEEDGVDAGTPTFRFIKKWEFSPNVQSLKFGEIVGVNKGGHDYAWATFDDEEDEEAGRIIASPVQVNVDQVYPEAAHAELFQLPS